MPQFCRRSRARARAGYAAARAPLAAFDDYLAARCGDEQAWFRVTFQRLLSSVDDAAARLLADDDLPGPGPAAGAAGPAVPPAAPPATVDVLFTLPAEVQATSVALCGEFNGWSADGIRLQRGGDGCWQATVPLPPGRSYRFRYLLDGARWENAWQADRYVPNPFGGTDSVVVVP